MALSYFDKAIIFLLPIVVLFFFNDKTIYLSIEYIYSVTLVAVPLLDLGLSGYFFYAYRNSTCHKETTKNFVVVFQSLYLCLFLVGIGLIFLNHYIFDFEELIIFIVTRILFVLSTTFLASFYRLMGKPEKVLYISIFSNAISLLFVFVFFFGEAEFSLWLIFIGQILFCIYYLLVCLKTKLKESSNKTENSNKKKLFLKAIMFSWPTMLQVFITMYITNYGKINALDKMTVEDGVLLSLIQRLSMIVFLTHSSLWAYLIKDVYVKGRLNEIHKGILFKYLSFLSLALLAVSLIAFGYLLFNFDGPNLQRSTIISSLIIAQTFFGCILAYLELHYGRENKNIITLYLAILSAVIFVSILTVVEIDILLRISIAMFISTFVTLMVSVLILKRRNYKIV